jgi:hypothetical protein
VVSVERGFARAENPPAAAAQPAPAAAKAAVRERAAARVRAAEDLLELLRQREQAGEAVTVALMDLKAAAQRRLAEARIDATDVPAERIRAAEEYVGQARQMLEVLQQRRQAGADVTRLETAQGACSLADAEYLLAKLQAEPG